MSFDYEDVGDVFDSRDVEGRIDELEAELEEVNEAREALDDFDTEDEYKDALTAAKRAIVALGDKEEETREYDALCKIRDDVSSREWSYGITFVKDSYWVDYCEEMVKDIGDMPKDIPSYIEVDWAATARNIQQDYSCVDIGKDTYWYRG